MRYIICSKCGDRKNIRHQRYTKLLAIHQNDREKLKASYLCRECKLVNATRLCQCNLNNISLNVGVQHLSGYTQLKNKLGSLVKSYDAIGGVLTVNNRGLFYTDVKNTLAAYFIRDFLINVRDNKVVSIEIQNIPFTGKHNIEVQE